MDRSQSRAREKAKYDVIKLIKRAAPKALYALAGYFAGLCALPFGAHPFGFALLAAADRNAVFVYAGLAVSCFFGMDSSVSLLYFGVYSVLLLLRVLVRFTLDYPLQRGARHPLIELLRILFAERPIYRILASAIAAFALGTCLLISDGFLYYDLFSLLIATAVAPLGAYLFYCFFERKGIVRDLGALALFASCVYGAADIKLYGVSLAVFGAMCLTFFTTYKRGIIFGAITGAMVGLAYSPVLCPVFIFSALCMGIFMKISVSLAFFASFSASIAWGFYVKGIEVLDGFFAGVLSACLIYSVFHKIYVEGSISSQRASEKTDSADTQKRCTALTASEFDGIRLFEMNRRMSAMSDGLERLSGFFEQIKLRFPKSDELLKICNEAFESSCVGCAEYKRCRERGSIEEQSERLAALLEKNRRVESGDVERELVLRCGRLPDILDEINYNSGARAINREPSGEAFALDYKALSELLAKSMENENSEYKIDQELSATVCKALDAEEIEALGAMVYGERKRYVYIKAGGVEELQNARERIFAVLCEALDFSLDRDSLCIRKAAEGGILTLCEAERLRVSFVSRQKKAKGEEEFCGDSLAMFQNADNRFFALISDGMGSGRDAAAVSEICAEFLGNMLEVGSMNRELLAILNRSLCGRSEGSLYECSATVDLLELDLVSGNTEFFKCGAAPSYVFRDGSLFKLRSHTMPIGILEKTDSKNFNFKLSAGDVVVMISDGVTGGQEECPWLFDLLRQNVEHSGLERTAELILKYAVGHGSQDDISVVIIKIDENEN